MELQQVGIEIVDGLVDPVGIVIHEQRDCTDERRQ